MFSGADPLLAAPGGTALAQKRLRLAFIDVQSAEDTHRDLRSVVV